VLSKSDVSHDDDDDDDDVSSCDMIMSLWW
jgi:hypothetical protein